MRKLHLLLAAVAALGLLPAVAQAQVSVDVRVGGAATRTVTIGGATRGPLAVGSRRAFPAIPSALATGSRRGFPGAFGAGGFGPGAFGFGGFGGGVGGYGGNFTYGPYATSLYLKGDMFVPPYFALHPPVYYGKEIVYRNYGSSPFAYGYPFYPGPTGQAQPTPNPYVPTPAEEEGGDEAAATGDLAAQPRMIVNPFYDHAGRSDQQLVDAK